MEKHIIQKLLRAVHDTEYKKLSDFIVVIRHRGAPKDEKEIDGKRIIYVKKSGFEYENRFGKETFIPAHRILRIKEK